ncbi:piercer of microtubule wall 1 protein [Wyeomyia smithii]|uniref:piercer of microtubule wall 1 protein n=1 Tax=Wyeomyia smithii TaxID=174621 RepID=UPI002467FD3E|nr:piercer of microtubule wall 1 protein [Wyeomyia smithii]
MDSESKKNTNHDISTVSMNNDLRISTRFETPYLFQGYGNQRENQNPIYRTSNSDYGYFTPCPHTVPHKYFPKSNKFTSHLRQCGMFRNFSLNKTVDRSYCDLQ